MLMKMFMTNEVTQLGGWLDWVAITLELICAQTQPDLTRTLARVRVRCTFFHPDPTLHPA